MTNICVIIICIFNCIAGWVPYGQYNYQHQYYYDGGYGGGYDQYGGQGGHFGGYGGQGGPQGGGGGEVATCLWTDNLLLCQPLVNLCRLFTLWTKTILISLSPIQPMKPQLYTHLQTQ